MVRCVASQNLPGFAGVVEEQYLHSEILEMFEVLAKDDMVMLLVCVRLVSPLIPIIISGYGSSRDNRNRSGSGQADAR